MTCSCDTPGFCPVYNRQMTDHLIRICQGKSLTPEKCEAYRRNWKSNPLQSNNQQFILTDKEISELFPEEDPTLIGNRIRALTDTLGIPPCGGCEQRRIWLNSAHSYLRSIIPKGA